MATNKKTDEQKTVVIIGASLGAVAVAARLAKAGLSVTLIDQDGHDRENCSSRNHGDYQFDQGPSFLTFPHVVQRTYHDLGSSMGSEGVKLLKCNPSSKVWFHDGQSFKMSTDLATMKSEVERWEGTEGFERYLAFMQHANRNYGAGFKHITHRTRSLLHPSSWWHSLSLWLSRSMYQDASRYFWTERLRQAFTTEAVISGLNPFKAPAACNVLQYAELADGKWYPRGGPDAIISSLVRLGQQHGVVYQSSTISRVSIVKHGRCTVQFGSVDRPNVEADLIIYGSSSDAIPRKHLLPTSIILSWSLSRSIPEFEAYNIFVTQEYTGNNQPLFKPSGIPEHSLFSIKVPNRVDSEAANAGCDIVEIEIPIGIELPSTAAWTEQVAEARRHVLSAINTIVKIDLEPLIDHEIISKPSGYEADANPTRHRIHGPNSISKGLPHNIKVLQPEILNHRSAIAPALCLIEAKRVAEEILDAMKVKVPWPRAHAPAFPLTGSDSSGLDQLKPPVTLWSLVRNVMIFSAIVAIWYILWIHAIWLDSMAYIPIAWGDEYLDLQEAQQSGLR